MYLTNRTIKVNDDKEFELLVDEINDKLHQGQLNMNPGHLSENIIGNENSAEELAIYKQVTVD